MRASTYPLLPVEEVERIVMERTPVLPAETVPLADASGRALAEDVVAPADLPRWPVSAVDGFAVRSSDGGGRLRVVGESAAGRPLGREVGAGEAVQILTGAVLPPGADSVVMVEDVRVGPDWVEVPRDWPEGRNFHRPGSDVKAAEVVLRAGDRLGPAEIGLVGSLGMARVSVGARPMVALLSTGD